MSRSWRLELSTAAGIRGRVVLELLAEGPARFEAVFTGVPLGPGLVVVREHELRPPRGRLVELRGEGIWLEVVCESPGEHWTFGLEAFGLRVEHEDDDVGERIPVGYDLEWETPDGVHGELLVDALRLPVDGVGTLRVTDG